MEVGEAPQKSIKNYYIVIIVCLAFLSAISNWFKSQELEQKIEKINEKLELILNEERAIEKAVQIKK